MKYLRAHFHAIGLLIFAVLTTAELSAQNTFPTVYVSTASGNQILAINGASSGAGAVSVLCSGGNKFVPEDIVVGPDGLIYVANTSQDQIWRIDPVAVLTQGAAPSCVSGAGTEKIYDLKSTKKCTDISGVQPPITSCPSAPEGPSFVSEPTANSTGSLDLVFNTHTSSSTRGVWVIPGIASQAIGCGATNSCPAPARIIQPLTASAVGEGIEFDIPGNMLIVDQADGTLFRKTAPPFPILNSFAGSAVSFITGLTSPVGVAVNTCGDILVTSGNTIQRYVTPAFAADNAPFSSSDIPRFMEVDSSDRLYVVTAADESGTGGKVWLINLSPGGSVGSCSLSSAPILIADLAALKSAKTVANLGSGNALGLGISATDFTTQVQCFNSFPTENTYNFGTSTASVKCDSGQPFCMQITALKSRPTNSSQPEVTFTPPFLCEAPNGAFTVPLSNPVSLHYSSLHGFSTQYWEQACTDSTCTTPIPDSDFNSTVCVDPNFHYHVGYFTLDEILFPGGAHAATDGRTPAQIATDPYPDCLTTQYWGNAAPGVDGGFGSRLQTKHVGFTSSSLTKNGVITLKQPALSNNPQFNVGTQNISVKFTLADSKGKPITNAVERLSIIRTSVTTPDGITTNGLLAQNVVASNNSSFENFFSSNGSGQYNYNVDTSFFTLDNQPAGTTAVYSFTIWGNDAPPFTRTIVGTF